ncbi:hypothetical protein NKH82_05565 [Mesorhizobium sp. M0915]|uniref:hypothetical protein n=1 Tax=unclassified Mesorhizobium TaxID=325217 RepID=UPI00041ADAE1|nr:hypothetical protein [Mesorhizobium sp. LSHC420B00]
MTRANSVSAAGIDLRQPRSRLYHAPLRGLYSSAHREILGQHFFSALMRELGPVNALPGVGNF